MTRLEEISVNDLLSAMDQTEDPTAIKRLMVAILYKRGPSVPMIAEWFDLRAATIYRWFDRLETEPLPTAASDRQRPGRPPKLTAGQRTQLSTDIEKNPSEWGYDTSEWSPQLIQSHLQSNYDTTYSIRHIHRILEDIGRNELRRS